MLVSLDRMSLMGLETNEEEVEVCETSCFDIIGFVVRRMTKQQ